MASYKRSVRYEPGETLIACDICELPVRFPSEAKRLDTGKFYCFRHVEFKTGKTALSLEREHAAFKPHDNNLVIGRKPGWWS